MVAATRRCSRCLPVVHTSEASYDYMIHRHYHKHKPNKKQPFSWDKLKLLNTPRSLAGSPFACRLHNLFISYLNSYLRLDYVQPALETGYAYFNDRPILTVCPTCSFILFHAYPFEDIFGHFLCAQYATCPGISVSLVTTNLPDNLCFFCKLSGIFLFTSVSFFLIALAVAFITSSAVFVGLCKLISSLSARVSLILLFSCHSCLYPSWRILCLSLFHLGGYFWIFFSQILRSCSREWCIRHRNMGM